MKDKSVIMEAIKMAKQLMKKKKGKKPAAVEVGVMMPKKGSKDED